MIRNFPAPFIGSLFFLFNAFFDVTLQLIRKNLEHAGDVDLRLLNPLPLHK